LSNAASTAFSAASMKLARSFFIATADNIRWTTARVRV
jgi:hypothetical protein